MVNDIRPNMKIVVIGGSGLIGSKVVARLSEHGYHAVAASPASGGDGKDGAKMGALRVDM